MSTFSSANVTDGNLLLKERTHTINNKIQLHILGVPPNELGNWLIQVSADDVTRWDVPATEMTSRSIRRFLRSICACVKQPAGSGVNCREIGRTLSHCGSCCCWTGPLRREEDGYTYRVTFWGIVNTTDIKKCYVFFIPVMCLRLDVLQKVPKIK